MTYVDADIIYGSVLVLETPKRHDPDFGVGDYVFICNPDHSHLEVDGKSAIAEMDGVDFEDIEKWSEELGFNGVQWCEEFWYLWVGVRVGGAGEYTTTLGNIEPSTEDRLEASKRLEKLPEAIRKLMAPLSYYILWSHS